MYETKTMQYEVIYPDRDRLEAIHSRSPFQTPDKVRKVMGDFRFPSPPDHRPYLYGCMVLSFDGKMSFVDDPEGHLISSKNSYDAEGGKTDFWIMNVCRMYADAVILGTGSLRVRMHKLWYAEVSDPELVEARETIGKKTAQPLNIIASIDGTDVPLEHPIFGLAPKPIILTSMSGWEYLREQTDRAFHLLTAPTFEDLLCNDSIGVVAAGDDLPDTNELLKQLRKSNLHHISVESPGYCWHLIGQKLLDEFILNYSGLMVGGHHALGTGQPFTTTAHPHVALLAVGATKGFMYTRQLLVND